MLRWFLPETSSGRNYVVPDLIRDRWLSLGKCCRQGARSEVGRSRPAIPDQARDDDEHTKTPAGECGPYAGGRNARIRE